MPEYNDDEYLAADENLRDAVHRFIQAVTAGDDAEIHDGAGMVRELVDEELSGE